jgi:predicted ArsR family transcriptional regulator
MTTQLDIEDVLRYPRGPGWRNRDTSKAAAVAIAPRVQTLRDRVLAEIKRGQGTADEIAERLGETPLAIRPRCTEAGKLGLIADAGIRRSNVSGRSAIVWRAVNP